MENENDVQIMFHRNADAVRFFNRLDNPWIRRREMQTLGRLASLASDARSVLEVGCGEGSNMHYLAKIMPQATLSGADFSKAKIEFAKRIKPGCFFYHADALSLPFNDASFDFVFCRDLLHHVDFNRMGVIAEMMRVVRPGGTIAVLESRGKTPLNLLFQLLYPAERGLYHSNPASLLALGEKFGSAHLDFIEPSFWVRAMGFLLGWPNKNVHRMLCGCVYSAMDLCERLMAGVLPKRWWVYMLLTINPTDNEIST